jgi:para-nitrobenzyl esterase
MSKSFACLLPAVLLFPILMPASSRVKTAYGVLEATAAPVKGVYAFKGIPFAQPPVGDLRWREPLPPRNWTGIRNADQFGPRCMQRTTPTADYWFRSDGMSEDCLYLNVWTPAKSNKERLPVLVYIFGGGFQNGDGSEPRYDGAAMAAKGMVAVSLNYRTNVFGFFTHAGLVAESPHKAAGNYGLLDQVAALRWVRQNIAAFGGDPNRVTIAGESAGSLSVSALMVSPLARGLFAGAIGESGALISTLPPPLIETAIQNAAKFTEAVGTSELKALRAMPAEQLLDIAAKAAPFRFVPVIDGYYLTKSLAEAFQAGEQAKVPLLAGANSEEMNAQMILGGAEPTPENFAGRVAKLYGSRAPEVLKAYAGATRAEVLQAATDLASDRFISHGTWKWTELHMQTGGKPVYRYLYTRIRPPYQGMPGQAPPPPGPAPLGAVHAAEIQYAMGNLHLDNRYPWEPADYKVSGIMQAYFVNFIKTGNPNGSGLPEWPVYASGTNYLRLRIGEETRAEPEPHRARYLLLDTLPPGPRR